MLRIMQSLGKRIDSILFIAYVVFSVWFMLLMREQRLTDRIFEPRLFWAFSLWITGAYNGKAESLQYIQNILFFIPFGFLFPWKKWKFVLWASLLTSSVIETTQYIYNIGWSELDDVISNTLGALIGFGLYIAFEENYRRYRKFRRDSHVD